MLGTAMGGASIFGNIAAGRAEEKAYQAEAQQAEMQAEQDEIQRRRELNDALAMQSVMIAASGRAAGVGSTKQIVETDISRAGQDIAMIKAGGKSKAAGLRSAGRQAKMRGYTQALSSAGKTGMSMAGTGAFSQTKAVK